MGQFSFQRPDTDIPVDEKATAFKRPASDIPVDLKKKGHSTFALPTGAEYSENGGQSDLDSQNTNPTGFRTVDTSKPTLPAHTNTIDLTNSEAEIEKQQKAQKEAQAQYDKDHPDTGTWSNALPTLFHATLGVITKGAAGIGNIARDISGLAEPSNDTNVTSSAKALYKEDPWEQNTGELTEYGKLVDAGKTKDALGKMIIGLDAYNNETAKTDYENHLPKTFLGNTATGLINIAPIAATAALFPEAEVAEGAAAGETSVNLAALQKLKTVAYNPFTKVSAIQGGLNAFDAAKQKGETPGEALLEGGEGLLKEGGQAAVYNILGEFGGNYLSPKIAEGLTESGILKDGKLTRMGTDAASDAIVFGAYPIASNLVQGKPVDWDEVEQGIGTGFAFGLPKALHTYGDFSDADSELKQTGDAVALKNFYDAAPEAIKEAYHLPDNAIDLNAKAVDYAAKAKTETDLGKRKELIAASSMYQKLADVKTTTQAVLGDPAEFINNINSSADLSDEQKAGLISKIKAVPNIISADIKADPINNFADATAEDMVSAMQRPETAEELQSMALAKGMAAKNTTDPELQNSLAAEQQELQKHADIKTIGNTVIQHGFNNFHDAVNNSDFPDDLKSTLISKAHGINQEFNPVIKEQAETQQTVTDLNSKIDDLQHTPGATDPVTNPAGVNELIDLVEKRTDAQVDLLAKVADNPDQVPGVAEGEKIADELNLPEDEQAKKGTEKTPEEEIHNASEGDEFQTTPITADHEEFGKLKFTPAGDGEYSIHYAEGTADKLSDEEIKRVFHIDPKTGEEFVPPEEDVVNQQRSGGEWMHPDQVEASQKLLEKVFPNIETVFHPTTDEFAEAARANGIGGETLPNAFIDKIGKINFNPESINKDTQLHEYGHILVQWAQEKAPALYQRMISFGRDATEIHKELLANGYKLTKKRLAEEAFVTMLGKHGEGKLDEAIKNGGTRGTIAKLINDLWNKFQRYLIEKTGLDISRFKNIKNMPLNEFLDTINSKYLLSENKIGDIGTKSDTEVEQQRQGRPIKREDETFADFARRVIDWTREQQTGQHIMDFTEPIEQPSIEPKPSDTIENSQEYDPDLIEANNAYMDAKVEGKFGVDALTTIIAKLKDTNLSRIVDQVKEEIKKDSNYLENTRNRVLKKEGGNEKDQAALLMDQYHLREKEENLINGINKETDTKELKKLQKQLAINQNEILDNATANRMIGREASSVFRLRQVAVDQETNLSYMREKYMATEGLKKLTPEQEEFVRNQYQRIRDAEIEVKNIKDQESQTRSENERLKNENDALKKIIEGAKAKHDNSKDKYADKLTKIRKDIDGSKQRLKELVFGHTNSLGILHPEIYRELKNIAVKKTEELYVKTKTSIELNHLIKSVLDEIKEIAPNITERDVRDALTDNYEKKKPRMKSDLQKNIEELKRQAKVLNDYQDFIDGNEYPPKVTDADKSEIDDLRKEKSQSDLDEKEWNVKRYKELQRKINDYEEKINKGDFTTPAKEARKFDKSQKLIDAEHEVAVRKFLWDKQRKAALLKSRSIPQKIIDNILAWQRFSVLSYPSTIVKLIATVLQGVAIKPLQLAHQELAYRILHYLGKEFNRSGASGDINGKVRVESIVKYYSAFVRNFSGSNLKNAFKGIDQADIKYGQHPYISEYDLGSGFYNAFLEAPGRSHGYIKSFLKAPETAFAHEQLMQSYVEKSTNIQKQLEQEGLSDEKRTQLEKQLDTYDLSNDETLERINTLAAAQGRWGILMNENHVVEKVRGFMSSLGILGDIGKSELPVLKIPMNYFNRYFLMKLGLLQAITGKKNFITGELETPGLINIMTKGTEHLTDQNKEILSRLVSYGSMGATLFATGWLLSKNIKHNDDGSVEINGAHIPKSLVHSPAIDIFLSGAETSQRIEKLHGKDNAGDWVKAFAESDIDVVKKMPFTSQLKYGFASQLAQGIFAKSEKTMGKELGRAFDKKVADMITPGFIKEWAQAQDENSKGELIKRNPQNLLENIEVGIPGLREDVKKK